MNAIIVLTNDLHDDPLSAWPMSYQTIPLKSSIDFAFFWLASYKTTSQGSCLGHNISRKILGSITNYTTRLLTSICMYPVRSNQSSSLLNRLLMPPCTKLDRPILILATCYQGLSMSLWRCWARQLFLAKQGCSQRNAVTGLCTIDLLPNGNKPLAPQGLDDDFFCHLWTFCI